MENYLSVDEISTELNVNRNTIYKKIKKLGLDSKKLDQESKKLLQESVEELHKRRNYADEFDLKAKNLKSASISSKRVSTLEERLIKVKTEYNNVVKSLDEVQLSLDIDGSVLRDDKNSKPYANPLLKSKCELCKTLKVLDDKIQDLEEKLKLANTSTNSSAIDD